MNGEIMGDSDKAIKIGAVLVTYNRPAELKNALGAYDGQTRKPDYLVIVDNDSEAETKQLLDEWSGKSQIPHEVIRLDENTGGAGGFHEGMKAALLKELDWLWIADDDAFPREDTLERLEIYIKEHAGIENQVSALCTRVEDSSGRVDLSHRCRLKKWGPILLERLASLEEYKSINFEIDILTYVGSLLNMKAVEQVGITKKDYFIYYDDAEHSLRLRKYGKILCIPSIVVYHPYNHRVYSPWKEYYRTRNFLLMTKEHFGGFYFCTRTFRKVLWAIREKKRENRKAILSGIRDAWKVK